MERGVVCKAPIELETFRESQGTNGQLGSKIRYQETK